MTLRGGTLYVGLDAGGVQAVDALTGAPVWTFATSGAIKGFVYADRLSTDLYFATPGALYSVRDPGPPAASPKWPAMGIPFTNPSTPVFIAGGDKVYVGGLGHLFRLEALDGSPFDDFVLGDGTDLVGSPTIDLAANFVYVGTDAGVVYAIRLP